MIKAFRMLTIAAAALSSACSLSLLQTSTLVDTDSTTSNGTTYHFSPAGTWEIKYSYDCSRQNSEGVHDTNTMTIQVFNADDDSTAFEHPETDLKGVKQAGYVYFTRGGTYYVKVQSQCDWQLQVLDTSAGGGPAPTASSART